MTEYFVAVDGWQALDRKGYYVRALDDQDAWRQANHFARYWKPLSVTQVRQLQQQQQQTPVQLALF